MHALYGITISKKAKCLSEPHTKSDLFIASSRVLGRFFKVGVQNLKQGVQVLGRYNGPPFLTSPLAEFGQFCAVAI